MLYGLCAEYLTVFLAPEDPRLEMDPRHKKFLLGQSQEGYLWYGRQLGKMNLSTPGLLTTLLG